MFSSTPLTKKLFSENTITWVKTDPVESPMQPIMAIKIFGLVGIEASKRRATYDLLSSLQLTFSFDFVSVVKSDLDPVKKKATREIKKTGHQGRLLC